MGILRRDRVARPGGGRRPTDHGPSGPGQDSAPDAAGTQLATLLASAADRVGDIVVATTEILGQLQRAQATDMMRTRTSHGDVLDMLVARTSQLRGEAQELAGRVGAARRELGLPAAPVTVEEHRRATPEPDGEPDGEPAADEAATREPPSEGIRLLVNQLAVMGHSRLEIEEQLRDQLGISDARAQVTRILGPE